MGRKHDTTYGVISRRRGGTGEGNGEDNINWANVNLTGPKIKKIHTVNSVTTNKW
jgi:hypothetical protein